MRTLLEIIDTTNEPNILQTMPLAQLTLTENQIAQFHKLWFIYGNNGPKCTLMNHKLVQGFYESNENRIKFYKEGNGNIAEKYGKEYADKHGVTQECIDACLEVLNSKE
jgi:hypothetical protein